MSDTLRPPRVPTFEGSHDSFPILTEDDRRLLINVFEYSKNALEKSTQQVEELQGVVDGVSSRLEEHGRQLLELRQAVLDIRSVHQDVRDVRLDVQTLNKSVMANLADDAHREREVGALKAEVAVLARTSGAEAGKEAGAAVAKKAAFQIALAVMSPTTVTVLGLVGWIVWMVLSGKPVDPPALEADRKPPAALERPHPHDPPDEKKP